ncbi:MAG: spore maturation protein [Limnochordales bacterium]|nr:spore maturation protein [Limnochordales bacterium]
MALVWAFLMLAGIAAMALGGSPDRITTTLITQAKSGLQATFDLLAVVILWLGISRIAERTGLLTGVARLLSPLLRRLFPGLPQDHPALAPIAINLTANFLGLSNAATPFGLQAMRELGKSSPTPGRITPAMTTFLVLNSACVTAIPATAIALRAATGAAQPAAIAFPAALASLAATATVLTIDILWRRLEQGTGQLRGKPGPDHRRTGPAVPRTLPSPAGRRQAR